MARSANQKAKLLVLRQLLLKQTDEEHTLTVHQMEEELARWDISAERKSLYDDLAVLRRFGMDVQSRKGRTPGWFVGSRLFELPELKLLVDAVQSSRFITRKKSDTLIRKLEGLASVHQARQLQRQVFVSGRVKTMNERIYYSVDKLHIAVGEKRAVSFRYFDYNSRREKVYRHGGARYAVSPCGLVWDNENYYLVGWDHASAQIRHYRVDKMTDVQIAEQPRCREAEQVDMEGYTRKHFGMFRGEEKRVTLRCREEMAGVVLDRFGQDAMLVPGEDGYFTASVDVVVSPQFWGWLFGLDDGVELAGPQEAVEEYRARLAKAAKLYADE